MRSSTLAALAASLSQVSAVYQGFNYGSSNSDGTPKTLATFTQEFNTAKNLVGTSGFSSARLYTTIQAGSSTNEFIQAIPAAINTGTTLLLGIWASAGQGHIDAELIALKSAIAQYGTSFTSIVAGLSVGSEDLYRISPTGIKAKSGYGADPDTLVKYINQVRSALAGTPLAGVQIGHVDTWTAWVNGTNSAVIKAVDWLGVDAYPYFQNTESNGIENNAKLFNDAYAATAGAAGGKDVWITETGFPVSGPTENLAVPSLANAKAYWNAVGCANFGKVNTWWYTLFDAPSAPSFGIVGSGSSTTPLFDLTCSPVSSSSSAAASSSAAPSSSAAASSAPTASAAPTGLASSGGGLSPSQGGGIASQANSASATPSATGPANSANPTASASRSSIGAVGGAGNGTATRSATNSATLVSGANPVGFSLATGALALVFAAMSVL